MSIRLPWRRGPHRALRPVPPAWVNARTDQPAPQNDEAPAGCGWFDSSHELNHGLQVTEHGSPDPVANEVPLGWWLDWLMNDSPAAQGHVTAQAKVAPVRPAGGAGSAA